METSRFGINFLIKNITQYFIFNYSGPLAALVESTINAKVYYECPEDNDELTLGKI